MTLNEGETIQDVATVISDEEDVTAETPLVAESDEPSAPET
jgi:hypothetical protein